MDNKILQPGPWRGLFIDVMAKTGVCYVGEQLLTCMRPGLRPQGIMGLLSPGWLAWRPARTGQHVLYLM